MSQIVDLDVPEGIPHTGLYTSDQGAVSIEVNGGVHELARIERCWIRLMNGVAVYRETGRRWGTTYAGGQRVTGQITRAFVNMGLLKLALGTKPTTTLPVGPGILTYDQLLAILIDTVSFPKDQVSGNFYPFKVDISIDINRDVLPVTDSEDNATNISPGSLQTMLAKNCILGTYALAFDSRGLITSGPIDLLGSSCRWSKS